MRTCTHADKHTNTCLYACTHTHAISVRKKTGVGAGAPFKITHMHTVHTITHTHTSHLDYVNRLHLHSPAGQQELTTRVRQLCIVCAARGPQAGRHVVTAQDAGLQLQRAW